MRYESYPRYGWCRFYRKRYLSKRYRDDMKEALDWDYTRANILRKEPTRSGFMNVIGWYADYIKHVNKRKRKHGTKSKTKT